MKYCLFLFLAFILVSCSQIKVIEHPDSETVNDYRSIYRIELTDTATILYGNVYNRPNYWVTISSGSILKGRATGKTYKLLKSVGYELDKKVHMPDSLPVIRPKITNGTIRKHRANSIANFSVSGMI